MGRTRAVVTTLALLLALGGLSVVTGSRGLAQDETPERPSHIHSGDCDELGPVVQPLTFLTEPQGNVGGNADAVNAEAAFTNIPQTLNDLLSEDHALKVHLSREQIEVYLACGDIGGALDANGALIVGMKEFDGSGYAGIAYLAPAANGGTDVSVMIAKILPGGGPGDDSPAEDEEQAAEDEEAAEVDVSLAEFAIDMPTELEAGLTRFNITNDGGAQHNFVIEGEGVSQRLALNLQPGEAAALEVDLPPGNYVVFCPVGQGAHRANGMEVQLIVGGGGSAADAGDADAGGAEPAADAEVVGVALTEFAINMPTELQAGPTRFNITNAGAAQHNFVIEGEGISEQLPENLAPRTSGTIELDLPPGNYVVYCPVGQGTHRANGMELQLTVV